MSTEQSILLAGFGGQGVLFAGKVIAYAGLIDDREVSWLPSYGPEMRGGTANCSVTLSDEAIGSPLITTPDILLALNQPSFDKFIDAVRPGGIVIADTSMITPVCNRDDIELYGIPATTIAEEAGLNGLANIVLLGKLFSVAPFCSRETLDRAIEKCVPARKAHLVEKNKEAITVGMEA